MKVRYIQSELIAPSYLYYIPFRFRTHKTETCKIFQDEKYFSTNAQPPSVLPVTCVTHKVTFTSYGTSYINYWQSSLLSSNSTKVCKIRHTSLKLEQSRLRQNDLTALTPHCSYNSYQYSVLHKKVLTPDRKCSGTIGWPPTSPDPSSFNVGYLL
jgi:hypothetical protein